MSNAVSALNGASYQGFVSLREMGLQGMITLRGDLASPALVKAAQTASGADMPGQRQITGGAECGIAWMSPDELLILVPYAQVGDKIAQIEKLLKDQHFLAVKVSDARAMFRIEGKGVRDVIAKLAPVDMSAEAFKPGDFRRTRMAQVPAAFWMPDAESVHIICFRSVAEYMFNLLKDAAEPGSEVGHLT